VVRFRGEIAIIKKTTTRERGKNSGSSISDIGFETRSIEQMGESAKEFKLKRALLQKTREKIRKSTVGGAARERLVCWIRRGARNWAGRGRKRTDFLPYLLVYCAVQLAKGDGND